MCPPKKVSTAVKAKSPEIRLENRGLIPKQLTKAVIGREQHRDDNLHVEAMRFKKEVDLLNTEDMKMETATTH